MNEGNTHSHKIVAERVMVGDVLVSGGWWDVTDKTFSAEGRHVRLKLRDRITGHEPSTVSVFDVRERVHIVYDVQEATR